MQGVTVGYCGSRGNTMDSKPGRCKRTDGKKWRCSRDVVVPGQKYCERHVHRGRNRSRNPAEFPSPLSTTTTEPVGVVGFAREDVIIDCLGSFNPAAAAACSSQLDQRVLSSHPDRKFLSQNEPTTTTTRTDCNKSTSDQVLRNFFNDSPGSTIQEDSLTAAASTSLSISTPGNPLSSTSSSLDLLKLSTGSNRGGGDDKRKAVVDDGEEQQLMNQQRQQQQLMNQQHHQRQYHQQHHQRQYHQQRRQQQRLMNQLNWNRTGGPLGALGSSTGSSRINVLHHQQ